jgi:putative transcriptional regulator
MTSTARRLLVSVPTLNEPNFFRSVVFMIEHNDDGAVGVVLNQPTDALLVDALPEWAAVSAPPSVAFVGGPVQQHDALIGLARFGPGGGRPEGGGGVEDSDAWQLLLGRIGTVDLGRTPADVRGDLEAVRVFAGYSGWGPGQLDAELEQGGWFVVDAHPDDLLTPDPASLWRVVLRRQGGDVAVSANYPRDAEPTAN